MKFPLAIFMSYLNFDMEARRIGAAFGIDAPLVWRPYEIGGNELVGRENPEDALRSGALLLRVVYSSNRYFSLRAATVDATQDKANTAVTCSWNGEIKHLPSDSAHVLPLTRSLFCLGYDIAPLEAEFDLTVSAHERLEWMVEFKEQLARLSASSLSASNECQIQENRNSHSHAQIGTE